MFVKSTPFKQVCQLLLSLIVASVCQSVVAVTLDVSELLMAKWLWLGSL